MMMMTTCKQSLPLEICEFDVELMYNFMFVKTRAILSVAIYKYCTMMIFITNVLMHC